MEVVFSNVNYYYNFGNYDEKKALNNVNVTLESNLIHGIIGPIGSGKTTMLELMNGVVMPTSGSISIGKYNLTGKKRNYKFSDFRLDVGLVYQFPEKQFFCNTVGEEIAFSLKSLKKEKNSIKTKVIKVLKMVGLDASYLKRNPLSLNSGERRRVAIASVLISNPKLLIFDEPTIGLDAKSKTNLMILLKKLCRLYNKTVIVVSHDVDILYELVDDVVVLNNGEVVCTGDKFSVFANTDLLDKNGAPIPNIVKFEKIVFDKYKIDLGRVTNTHDLLKAVSNNAR